MANLITFRNNFLSHSESATCLRAVAERNGEAPFVVLVGDSRMRNLRDQLAIELTGVEYATLATYNGANPAFYRKYPKYGDFAEFYPYSKFYHEFRFLPMLNSTGPGDSLEIFEYVKHFVESAPRKPTFMVIGSGIWRIRQCQQEKVKTQEQCAEDYKQ